MAYKNRAYILDAKLILSAAQTLPNNTNVDSSNVVDFGGNSAGKVKIVVKANTDIAIANTKVLTIKAMYGATTTPTDQLDGKILFSVTAGASGLAFKAGDTICEEIIPDSLPDNYRYVKLNYTTTADESTEKVDAFIAMV